MKITTNSQDLRLASLLLLLGAVACVEGSETTATDSATTATDSATTATDGATETETGDGDDPFCGDGVAEGDEECDDGNPSDDDACTNACTQAACGDGVIQTGVEECDAGLDNGPGNACTSACLVNVCGDGELGPGEGCDDGNAIDDDECSNACVLSRCGDGIVGPGEQCDDANDTETDDCLSTCVFVPPTLELGFSQVKQFDFSWEPVSGADYYQLLESADTGEPYVEVGDVLGSTTSLTLTVPLHFRLHASYKLRVCKTDVGCTDSAAVDVVGSLAEAVGYVKASNTGAGDEFGVRVALSADGSTLAVGAWREDSSATGIEGDSADDSASDAGAVYVFVRDGQNAWSQQAYIKASNTGAGDGFGTNVALSGDGSTLAVGAYLEDSGATAIEGDSADNSASDAGAVYVFVRDGQDAWSQQAYVKASNTETGDHFGISVALSGDGSTLAVAAYHEDSSATAIDSNSGDNSMSDAGAVYVFVRDGQSAWSQEAYVKASNTGAGDEFGTAVALSADGSTLAVGARFEGSSGMGIDSNPGDNSASEAGAAYVFVRDGQSAW